jgi:hypothetical protein
MRTNAWHPRARHDWSGGPVEHQGRPTDDADRLLHRSCCRHCMGSALVVQVLAGLAQLYVFLKVTFLLFVELGAFPLFGGLKLDAPVLQAYHAKPLLAKCLAAYSTPDCGPSMSSLSLAACVTPLQA